MSEIRLLTDFELIEMNCTSSSSLSLQNSDTKALNEALNELVIGGKFKDRMVDGRVISGKSVIFSKLLERDRAESRPDLLKIAKIGYSETCDQMRM